MSNKQERLPLSPDEYDYDALSARTTQIESKASSEELSLADEPLFVWLLRQAVYKTNPDDAILKEYIDLVAPNLSEHLTLKTAKGGDFVTERRVEGMSEDKIDRFRRDQSLRAHLVNGLLPTIRIAKALQTWGLPRFRHWHEKTYRLFCAGYSLHDWVKLPNVKKLLGEQGFGQDEPNPTTHMPLFEQIFRDWCNRLNLTQFLEPIGGLNEWLYDLIYIAVNTQRTWGTNLNQAVYPHLKLNGREMNLATDLSTVADLVAYVFRTPLDITRPSSLSDLLKTLSNGEAQLIYHHVSETRGVLTNFIHTAVLQTMSADDCVPLLYAPSGVVYLARQETPTFPTVEDMAEAAITAIRKRCSQQLDNRMMGFSRDGKGLKTAPYYNLLLTLPEQIRLAGQGVFKVIHSKKKPASGKRFSKIIDKGWLDESVDLDLPNELRTDQLAEYCSFISRLATEKFPDNDAEDILLTHLELQDTRPVFDALANTKNTGGVSYEWYYVAGVYVRDRAVGLDDVEWRERITAVGTALIQVIEGKLENEPENDGWGNIRQYIASVLNFGPHQDTQNIQASVAAELQQYQGAKLKGRRATTVCSLCSSNYEISPQREPGLLFRPQVYTNKQPLHGSKATRHICQICETEMMLRQVLVNKGDSVGKNFEDRKFRYIHFFPTYFYTPETLSQMQMLYRRLKKVSFTELRRELESKTDNGATIQLELGIFQRLQDFMMTPEPPEDDRLSRLEFPDDAPFTVAIIGIPPGREATDSEAWINPAWLSLVLPLILDVKVVATESPLPVFHEADDLDETIFFDAPHDYLSTLLGRDRINLDQLLTRLKALTVTYMIHMDGNANFSQGKYNWHRLPPLVRNLRENSLWAAAYLQKWQRKQELDTILRDRAQLYLQYIQVLDALHAPEGGINMSHAQELTTLYRQFYRHAFGGKLNSNKILRPIDIASKAILNADPRLFGSREGLVEVVHAEVYSFMDRVEKGSADGRFPKGSDRSNREAAMQAFSEYFAGEIYWDALNHDPAALRGKQLNLLKSACELVYRVADNEERRQREAAKESN